MSTDEEAAIGGSSRLGPQQPEEGDNDDDDDDGRVPIVDLTPLRAGGAAGKTAVAAAIKRCGCVVCFDVAGSGGSRCSTHHNQAFFHAIGTDPPYKTARARPWASSSSRRTASHKR